VPTDAGIEPRTVATGALAVRRCLISARRFRCATHCIFVNMYIARTYLYSSKNKHLSLFLAEHPKFAVNIQKFNSVILRTAILASKFQSFLVYQGK
jgi:hypothetical protein